LVVQAAAVRRFSGFAIQEVSEEWRQSHPLRQFNEFAKLAHEERRGNGALVGANLVQLLRLRGELVVATIIKRGNSYRVQVRRKGQPTPLQELR
jgi:hypothetical protein